MTADARDPRAEKGAKVRFRGGIYEVASSVRHSDKRVDVALKSCDRWFSLDELELDAPAPGTLPVVLLHPDARDWFADVMAFHVKMPSAIGSTPADVNGETFSLRVRLIHEEIEETLDAMVDVDLPGIADGIADSIYVLIGTAIAYGIDLRPVWQAVHEANMAKMGGEKRVDGKCLKPPGWTPPDIAAVLARQGPLTGSSDRPAPGGGEGVSDAD